MSYPIKTVAVTKTIADETLTVIRLAIAILVTMVLATQIGQKSSKEEMLLLPYQDPFDRLQGAEWSIFNELRSALEEICAFRVREGTWPSPEILKADFVLPFYPVQHVSGEIRYAWTWMQQGDVLIYLGQPDPSTQLPKILLKLEQAKDSTADPAHTFIIGSDSFHQKLPDGSVIHFSLWLHRGLVTTASLGSRPEMYGWRQVMIAYKFR